MGAKRVLYRGPVQGVGFRQTVHHIAGSFAISGYVKNRRDGSVELVADGSEAEVDRFLAAVASRMAAGIEGHTIQDISSPKMAEFTIQF